MLSDRVYRYTRCVIFTILLVTLLVMPNPAQVSAAPLSPSPENEIVLTFDILAVQKDTSVTIQYKDFPVRTKFAVKIARVGKRALDGEVVAEFNTEKGGTFEATYPLPETLKGELILAIRVDSPDHYSASNWFFNRDLLRKPDPSKMPTLSFADVKKDSSFTLKATNLVPNASYSLRVGPYYTFYRDYTFLDAVVADENGALNTPINLPERAKKAEAVQVRLDGGGTYVMNSFKNVDGGAAIAPKDLIKVVKCTLLETKPLPALAPGEEFDAVWTVQNPSNMDWIVDHLYYRFSDGEAMHKYKDIYPVGYTVAKGGYLQVTVDMIAPKEAGWHRTVWTVALLGEGVTTNTLCTLPISVFVKEQ